MSDDKSTLESTVEGYGIEKVRRLKGKSIKLGGYVGIPDRMHLIPGGIVLFVEYKRPIGGRYGPLQLPWQNWLRKNGFTVGRCNTKAEFDALLDTAIGR